MKDKKIAVKWYKALFLSLAAGCCVPAPAADDFGTGTPVAWGVLGRSNKYLKEERAAGIQMKVLEFFWKEYFPRRGIKNHDYVRQQRERIARLKENGFRIVLNIGANDAPEWIHQNYRNTRYVNQFGEEYAPLAPDGKPLGDSGAVNFVFNPQMRGLAEEYIAELFRDFPPETFQIVRIGSGRYGEIQYPLPSQNGKQTYWAYDAPAQASCPVPGWKPGQPSPNGEAEKFLNWYLDSLVEFQNWNIAAVRKHYKGPLGLLYPNWGTRPGQFEEAVRGNLSGKTAGEKKGQVSLGLDFARLMKAVKDPNVYIWCTCVNKSDLVHDSSDPRNWSAVRYLARLAENHPLKLQLIGENAGPHERFYMEWTLQQVRRFRVKAFFWAFEYQLFDSNQEWLHYATIDDYADLIREYNRK